MWKTEFTILFFRTASSPFIVPQMIRQEDLCCRCIKACGMLPRQTFGEELHV